MIAARPIDDVASQTEIGPAFSLTEMVPRRAHFAVIIDGQEWFAVEAEIQARNPVAPFVPSAQETVLSFPENGRFPFRIENTELCLPIPFVETAAPDRISVGIPIGVQVHAKPDMNNAVTAASYALRQPATPSDAETGFPSSPK